MPDVYQVRDLGFAFEVLVPGREPATVIPLDREERQFWCCDCAAYNCDHAGAVMHHVIDQESE